MRRVRQRASRSRAEFTIRFVGDFAGGRHRDNIINVATSRSSKAGRATSLGGRKCHAGQGCWEAVRYRCAVHSSWAEVSYYYGVDILRTSNGRCLAVGNCNLEVS